MTEATSIEDMAADVCSAELSNVGSVLQNLRALIDLREKVAELDTALSKRKTELEGKLLDIQKSSGLSSFADFGVSVTFDTGAFRAKYDPEKFNDVMKWAVETGNEFIIQRRLTDAKILGLIDEGVSLPEGLSVESYTKISVRRK